MALEYLNKKYLKNTVSIDEYIETRLKQDPSTGAATRTAYKNADLFCKDQFNEDFISVLGNMAAEVKRTDELVIPLNFMQNFINWMAEPHLELRMTPSCVYPEGDVCRAKDTGTIRGINGQLRLIMVKVGGIRISSSNVTDHTLSYPSPKAQEKKRKMTDEEFVLICDSQINFKRRMLYKIKKDTQARIGAMVQLLIQCF